MKQEPIFHKLPIRFDPLRLAEELKQFSESDWIPHEAEAAGNASIILVSVGGTLNLDFAISGPMKPTHLLEPCPYLKQVLQTIEMPLSRCRLLRLAAQTESPLQANHHYHWFRRRAIYIPIITARTLRFFVDDQEIQLAAGDVCYINSRKPHQMVNAAEHECIHLVIETRAPLDFGSGIEDGGINAAIEHAKARAQNTPNGKSNTPPNPEHSGSYGLNSPNVRGFRGVCRLPALRLFPFAQDAQDAQIPLEAYRFEVLTPQEIERLTGDILAEAEKSNIPRRTFEALVQKVEAFRGQWADVFARFGHHDRGELAYQDIILYFEQQIIRRASKWLRDSSGEQALETIYSMLNPAPTSRPRMSKLLWLAKKRHQAMPTRDAQRIDSADFEKPLFIVSAPRSGSTLLFETLAKFPDLWTIGSESHQVIEGIPELHPAAHNYDSNRLTEASALPHVVSALRSRFTEHLQDRAGINYLDLPAHERPKKVHFLEKTPKNALRIPFLKAAFPDARFIYLYREPRSNISSMIEGWRAQRFIPYQPLPGWPYRLWSFLLVPGWQTLKESSIAEIAAYQWKVANACILDDLQAIPPSDWCLVHYKELVQEPKKTIHKIAQFAHLSWDEYILEVISRTLPMSSMTLSAPSRDKWRKNEWELAKVLPRVEPIVKRMRNKKYTIFYS